MTSFIAFCITYDYFNCAWFYPFHLKCSRPNLFQKAADQLSGFPTGYSPGQVHRLKFLLRKIKKGLTQSAPAPFNR
jgi:hypothetical protein